MLKRYKYVILFLCPDILAIKRSAGVALGMSLKNPLYTTISGSMLDPQVLIEGSLT